MPGPSPTLLPPASAPAPGRLRLCAWLTAAFLDSPAGLRLVHDHGFCVGRLAVGCGVSVRTLERHLRRELGCCPGQWLRRQRMTEARRLLAGCPCVKTVALDLGYSQTAHFTVAFRDYWGLTPTSYLLAALEVGPSCQLGHVDGRVGDASLPNETRSGRASDPSLPWDEVKAPQSCRARTPDTSRRRRARRAGAR
jgi:AraC-like DNA-binding protein